MMMNNPGGSGGFWDVWILGLLALLLLVAGVLLVVIWARSGTRGARRSRGDTGDHQLTAAMLKERYATGKITLAEYEQTLKILGEDALMPDDATSDAEPRHTNRSAG